MRAQVQKTELQVTSPPVCELSAFAFVLLFWTTGLLMAAYLVEKTAPPPMGVIRDKKREPTVPLELRPDRGARAADGVGRRMGSKTSYGRVSGLAQTERRGSTDGTSAWYRDREAE